MSFYLATFTQSISINNPAEGFSLSKWYGESRKIREPNSARLYSRIQGSIEIWGKLGVAGSESLGMVSEHQFGVSRAAARRVKPPADAPLSLVDMHSTNHPISMEFWKQVYSIEPLFIDR